MRRFLYIILLLLPINLYAANPILTYTGYNSFNPVLDRLANEDAGYNGGVTVPFIWRAGNTYWMSYWALPGDYGTYPFDVASTHPLAYAASTAFPGAFTRYWADDMPPDEETTQIYGGIYNPVLGVWYTIFVRQPTYYTYGFREQAGSADTFPVTGWTTSYPDVLVSKFPDGVWTCDLQPLAGGGWVFYGTSAGLPAGTAGNLVCATAPDISGPWTYGGVLVSGKYYGPPNYIEHAPYFVYGGKYYWIVNRALAVPSHLTSTWQEELYSSTSQTGSLTFEGNLTTSGLITYPGTYLTKIVGDLNTGTAYATGQYDYSTYGSPYLATLTATPISNPEPVLSGISSSLDGTTLTVSGTATPGPGGDLWEVGLYDSTNGNRSKATWSSWGSSSPGTVANSFSATITVSSSSDVVTVTAYNVALESDSEIVNLSTTRTLTNASVRNGGIR